MAPTIVVVPSSVPPSKNCTVPAGNPTAGATTPRTAVNVIGCPEPDGSGDVDTAHDDRALDDRQRSTHESNRVVGRRQTARHDRVGTDSTLLRRGRPDDQHAAQAGGRVSVDEAGKRRAERRERRAEPLAGIVGANDERRGCNAQPSFRRRRSYSCWRQPGRTWRRGRDSPRAGPFLAPARRRTIPRRSTWPRAAQPRAACRRRSAPVRSSRGRGEALPMTIVAVPDAASWLASPANEPTTA